MGGRKAPRPQLAFLGSCNVPCAAFAKVLQQRRLLFGCVSSAQSDAAMLRRELISWKSQFVLGLPLDISCVHLPRVQKVFPTCVVTLSGSQVRSSCSLAEVT